MRKLNIDQINANKERILKAHAYERPSNYFGPDYPNTISIVGQSRDSDTIERSNFKTALELLGGESETVQVIRDSHWAVGWVETLRVDLADDKATNTAIEIILSLEDYPVLDDNDLSETENEERRDWAEQSKESTALVLCRMLGLPDELAETPDMLSLAFDLQYEYQYENGLDSSLYNNQYHVDSMSDRDKERYRDAFESLLTNTYYMEKPTPTVKLIAACFDIELEKGTQYEVCTRLPKNKKY